MDRKLAAILAADIVGFSRLVGADEEGTLSALSALRSDLIDPLLARFGGRIANTAGDSILAEFSSAVDSFRCASLLQEGMEAWNAGRPDAPRIEFRIGLNLGDVVAHGDDILGDGVNVAARLEALAPAGGIIISRSVRDQVRDRLDVTLADLGPIEVKNITRPVRAFQVLRENETPIRVPGKRRSPRAALAGLAGALALAIIAAAVFWYDPDILHGQGDLELPDRPSVAVLPFVNLSDDKGQEYFADGITDDLITDLSKLSGLFVISRNSVFTYKGRAARVTEVSRDLGVRYVLEGSVQRDGDQIRINAQLIDATSERHVWAERYGRESSDLFAVQDELVGRIVSALAVRLTSAEESRITTEPETNLEAYEFYLQALDGYFSRDMQRMQQSLALYKKSWTADPEFARAYAGYARLAAEIWRVSAIRGLSSATMRRASEIAARKALALNPELADTHSVLALHSMIDGNHDQAVILARQAVRLEPNSAEAHATLAVVLSYAGRHVEALDEIKTAMRLDPKPATTHLIYYGLVLFMNGQNERAIAVLDPVKDTPDRGLGDSPREILAMAHAENGDIGRARELTAQMRQVEVFLNLNYYRDFYRHHARPEDIERRIAALGKAGLPTWPLAYPVDGKPRLSAAELRELIDGKTWTGTDLGREAQFIQEFGADEGTVYAGETALLNGSAYVEGDELCEQYDGFVLGRELCGPVLRNPDGTAGKGYVYVNSATVKEFTLDE